MQRPSIFQQDLIFPQKVMNVILTFMGQVTKILCLIIGNGGIVSKHLFYNFLSKIELDHAFFHLGFFKYLEYCDSLVKMMVFQRGGCVNCGQWRTLDLHPFVILPSMIQVMAKTCYIQCYCLYSNTEKNQKDLPAQKTICCFIDDR